jgi:biotin carboxylase
MLTVSRMGLQDEHGVAPDLNPMLTVSCLFRLTAEAERVGFPLLVKAVSGGGGRGMKLAATPKVRSRNQKK